MFPIPNPPNFHSSLEESVKLVEQGLRLGVCQVLSLPFLPITRRLSFHLEILLADPLTALNQEIVNQVAV